MIHLHPIPDTDHTCPYCKVHLEVTGWYIPGMRTLANLMCSQCERNFYGDLPSGHGLYYPMILDRKIGKVYDRQNIGWFSDWLFKSYHNRTNEPIEITVEETRAIKNPLILNCLDTLYGHCLLKLLNAQYYIDHCPNFDLILLLPKFLRWMVPQGIAAIWSVDLPLKRGIEWNDWLAEEIRRRIEPFEDCWLSVALPHPHPNDFSIERYTGIKPFLISDWSGRMKKPTVTFIWRDYRCWWDEKQYANWKGLSRRLKHRLFRVEYSQIQIEEQTCRIITLAQELRKAIPNIDFVITGLGFKGGMPDWICDRRTVEINEDTEISWCKYYAKSHIVVGVHGSNMLLPSAHAGAVVELVPVNRWVNLIQDILVRGSGIREGLFRYRFLPVETSIKEVANTIITLLEKYPFSALNFDLIWCDHKEITKKPNKLEKERQKILDHF